MKLHFLSLILFTTSLTFGQATNEKPIILPAEIQIKTALLAAPADFRAEATVLGYDESGLLIELKKGTNDFICLAPDYKTPAYYASYCYPRSLKPLMVRGRELIAEGKRNERNQIRAEEFAQGKFAMPKEPTTMFRELKQVI